MKSIVIYTSSTGFTERYAKCLAEKLNSDIMTLNEAKNKKDDFLSSFDTIIYGGWAIGGKIKGSEWIINKLESLKGKKIALFIVGASPNDSEDIAIALNNVLNDEQKKYAEVFYCQGGLNYEKMPISSKIAMKFFSSVVKRKNREMGEMISKSYDIYDEKYLEPIIQYLRENC